MNSDIDDTTTTDGETKARKPFDAATLSALLPGLGHIYLGQFQRGILWIGAVTSLMLAAIIALLIHPGGSGFTFAMTLIVIGIGASIVCVVNTWRLARSRRDGHYQLREYNRWYVYVIFFLVGSVGSAVGLSYVLKTRVVQAFVIPTQSMMPTIDPGDRIVALKEVYFDRDPERGELVVFRSPENRRQFWIKRVVAVAGDQVEWRNDGAILVNGETLQHTAGQTDGEFTEKIGEREYSILLAQNQNASDSPGSLTVPSGHCFVLGDNRSNSKDSRHFGPVSYSSLTASPVAKVLGGRLK